MKRTLFGSHLSHLLRTPDAADGGGAGISSITGDSELDSAVMGRLGVEMEGGEEKVESGKEEQPKAEDEDEGAEKEKGGEGEEGKDGEETEETEAEAEGDTAAPEFTEEQQAWVDSQLAEKVTEIETLTAKVAELEQQAEAAGTQPLAVADVHPFFLADDPAELAQHETALRNFEKWALANWDGTEAVEAKGDQPAQPTYTAKQVRERYAQIKETREQIIPQARELIAARAKHQAAAKKFYPELFDAKRSEYKVAQNILRAAPGLKAVFPNVWTVIGDAIRGEKARLAEEKTKQEKAAAAKVKPKALARPAPAAGKPATTKPKGKSEPVLNLSKFMESGSDRAALVQALS